ncbi:MAG: enoyl-CoA hydratase [Gammaproteobacteria bacterium PRO9]|nr:enoyl-CoA hydratase [Gammaproteobacteria bacterium PRO9]
MAEALADITWSLDARADVRVAILTGAGSNFCSGVDFKAFRNKEDLKPRGRGFAGMIEARIDKPLIAAVEGCALAGGFEIALACDLIVASSSACFGLPEVTRGLAVRGGALLRLPAQLPYRIAMELLLTGAIVGVDRLAALGLVNRVVAEGQALAAALDLAAEIAVNAPLAISASKRIARDSRDWPTAEFFERQAAYTAGITLSPDADESGWGCAGKQPPRRIGP